MQNKLITVYNTFHTFLWEKGKVGKSFSDFGSTVRDYYDHHS